MSQADPAADLPVPAAGVGDALAELLSGPGSSILSSFADAVAAPAIGRVCALMGIGGAASLRRRGLARARPARRAGEHADEGSVKTLPTIRITRHRRFTLAPYRLTDSFNNVYQPQMSFDPATLMMVTTLIAATVGMLLVFAWAQNRAHLALAMWGGADLAAALATALLMTRNHAPDLVSIALPFGLLAGAYGVIWAATRSFSDRPPRPILAAAGPAILLIACAYPQFFQSTQFRLSLISLISATYTLAAAHELWRARQEHLLSRYPMVACLVLHASLLLARVAVALIWTLPPASQALTTPWVAIIGIEPAILVIVGGFLQLSMAKERSEALQRRAASTDELTGVASRRAFLGEGERRLKAALGQDLPVALLLFDLDHFKQINDRHGHQTGDAVLQAFAERAVEVLRPGDLFGRIGGEEFAALLANTDRDSALRVAERFRKAVEKIEFWEGDVPLRLTVSAGLSHASAPGCDLGSLLRQADHALYGAKAAGRNCVEQYRPRLVRTADSVRNGVAA